MDNSSTRGVEKGSGVTKNPMSYVIDGIVLTNYVGEELDIRGLMSTLKIYESLYTPFLMMDMLIVDQMNFFEEYRLNGQEKIQISLSTKYKIRGRVTEKKIDLQFFVVEYTDYARQNEQTQTYVIRGVTEHAYISPLKKISKPISGPVINTIASIFVNDLNVPTVKLYGSDSCSMAGVVPIQSPLKAISWLNEKAYDENNAPYYVHQDLTGTVNITSLSYMMERETYQEYMYKKFQSNAILSDDDFLDRQRTIIDIKSSLNLSKSYNAADGAYSSTARFIDVSDNTLREKKFSGSTSMPRSLNNDADTLSSSSLNIGRPEEGGRPLNDIPVANLSYKHVARNTYDGREGGDAVDEQRMQYAKAWNNKFETVKHNIQIPGDFDLRCGYVVELTVPKGVDPGVYKSYTGKSISDMRDKSMGGKYIVFSIVHVFDQGLYGIIADIRKDSVPA